MFIEETTANLGAVKPAARFPKPAPSTLKDGSTAAVLSRDYPGRHLRAGVAVSPRRAPFETNVFDREPRSSVTGRYENPVRRTIERDA